MFLTEIAEAVIEFGPSVHSALLIAVMSLVTIALRFLPFLIFGERKVPALITYLGKVLPYAIMGMLVIYCLKSISFTSAPYAIPELLGCAAVVLLHLWKRNTLLSIGGGTLCYMLFIRWEQIFALVSQIFAK